jgi:hypothetical protein
VAGSSSVTAGRMLFIGCAIISKWVYLTCSSVPAMWRVPSERLK